jgi:hypothetical protein
MVFYLKIIFKIIYFIFYATIFEKSLYTTIFNNFSKIKNHPLKKINFLIILKAF